MFQCLHLLQVPRLSQTVALTQSSVLVHFLPLGNSAKTLYLNSSQSDTKLEVYIK